MNDEEVEENANFSHTQKIPASLVRHQDKLSGDLHHLTQPTETFFNPKPLCGQPKLNNYLSQASKSK